MARPTKRRFSVDEPDGSAREIAVGGRDEWALSELIEAGAVGCTPITHPGPRWSAYVFKLKRRYGLVIETVPEPHRGDFPGTHARYILRSRVQPIEQLSKPNAPRWEPEGMSGVADG
jgi:hypothetical protein